jgi:hypothetical protein
VTVLAYSGLGVTRHVILLGPWALKIPRINYGWSMFLRGLLGNMQEAVWGRCGWDGFCPVVFAIPGGFLTVQRRVRVMTDDEFASFDWKGFTRRKGYRIPAERKADSFGWLGPVAAWLAPVVRPHLERQASTRPAGAADVVA